MTKQKLMQLAAGGAVGAGLAGVATAAVAVGAYRAWARRGYALTGKTVLITGGSRGLGFATAREFLRCGCRVALCARDAGELERARQRLQALGDVMTIALDLAEPGSAAAAVAAVEQAWGPVDVLAHVAGIISLGPWQAMSDDDFQRAMDVHCWAALRLARAVLPAMIQRGSGRIVNVSSIGGLVPVPHMLPYTVSKFALVGLSEGLASEVRRHGVRVGCVCPFLTRTGSQERVELKGDHESEFAWFAAAGSLPGLSQSAQHAARAIVHACRRGRALTVLTLPGKLAAWVHGLAPSATAEAMSMAERLLPASPGPGGQHARLGRDSYNAFTARAVKPLIHRSGRDLNQA
ncbi:MAG: SDR family NAD(P)-dependent oxidoreductase [Terriglobales bacterium]